VSASSCSAIQAPGVLAAGCSATAACAGSLRTFLLDDPIRACQHAPNAVCYAVSAQIRLQSSFVGQAFVCISHLRLTTEGIRLSKVQLRAAEEEARQHAESRRSLLLAPEQQVAEAHVRLPVPVVPDLRTPQASRAVAGHH